MGAPLETLMVLSASTHRRRRWQAQALTICPRTGTGKGDRLIFPERNTEYQRACGRENQPVPFFHIGGGVKITASATGFNAPPTWATPPRTNTDPSARVVQV